MDVVIPKKISGVQVKSIGDNAFEYGCNRYIVLPTASLNKYEIRKIWCETNPIGVNSVILPKGLESIGRSAFARNNLKTVIIPSTVTKIHNSAFADNQLQSVIFKGEKHSASVNAI